MIIGRTVKPHVTRRMKTLSSIVQSIPTVVEEPFNIRPAEPQPSVVNVVGLIALVALIPYATRYADMWISKERGVYKVLWALAFTANVLAVAVPGRFDSIVVQGGEFPWNNLFEPASWAFAIWPIIYLAELGATVFVASGGDPAKDFAKVTPYWLAGNLFQSAWCLSFRPQMKNYLWLPTTFLALSGVSLGLGHFSLTNSINALTTAFNADSINTLRLIRVPFALHAGWLAAAALANFNSWLAMCGVSAGLQNAVAFLSAFAAGAVGAAVTLRTEDPLPALTLAWALFALGARSQLRAEAATAALGHTLAEPVEQQAGVFQALANAEKLLAVGLLGIGARAVVSNDMF